MNRRDFFKVLGAAGLVAAVPTAALAVIPESSFTPTLSGYTFRRHTQLSDYETKIGLAAALKMGDDHYRHAIVLSKSAWDEFTPEQREETWRFVEQHTYNFAMKRRAS